MQTRLKVEKPGDIEYTMTITMSANDWEKLREQLYSAKECTSYPNWQLRREIDDLLSQARKIYWPKETTETIGLGSK